MKSRNIIYIVLALAATSFITYRATSNYINAKSGLVGGAAPKNAASGKKEGKHLGPKAQANGGQMGGNDRPAKVNGVVIVSRPFNQVVAAAGSVEADEVVEIRSEIAGLVEKIFFDEGAA